MLKALGRLMKSAGLQTKEFHDPVVFLAQLEHARCHVAVLDVWMPQMNGLKVQACLRKSSPKTQVIFISGRDDAHVRQSALEAGAFAFLRKPFGDETLLQLVKKAMSA